MSKDQSFTKSESPTRCTKAQPCVDLDWCEDMRPCKWEAKAMLSPKDLTGMRWKGEEPLPEDKQAIRSGDNDSTRLPNAFDVWWDAQTLKGDPMRRPNLVQEAFIAGANSVLPSARLGSAWQRVHDLEMKHQAHWNTVHPEKEAGYLAASHADENRALAYELAKELDASRTPSTAALPYDEAYVDELTGRSYDNLSPELRREFYINAHRLARRFEVQAKAAHSSTGMSNVSDEQESRGFHVLAKEIAECGQRAGVFNGQLPLSGPQLVLILNDMADALEASHTASSTALTFEAWYRERWKDESGRLFTRSDLREAFNYAPSATAKPERDIDIDDGA